MSAARQLPADVEAWRADARAALARVLSRRRARRRRSLARSRGAPCLGALRALWGEGLRVVGKL